MLIRSQLGYKIIELRCVEIKASDGKYILIGDEKHILGRYSTLEEAEDIISQLMAFINSEGSDKVFPL